MRPDLARWQWDGYPTYHQRPLTLWLHLFAVPAFVASTASLALHLARLDLAGVGLALLGMVVAFGAQGFAHQREHNPAIAFDGPGDALSRVFLEQFFTFPRFVLSGRWWRALRAPGA